MQPVVDDGPKGVLKSFLKLLRRDRGKVRLSIVGVTLKIGWDLFIQVVVGSVFARAESVMPGL